MPDRASTYGSARPNLNPTYSSARPSLPPARGHAQPSSFGLLGTYSPTQCGIATFTRALLRSIAAAAPDGRVGIVRVLDAPQGREGPEVAEHLRTDLSDTHAPAASALNSYDVAIVQHEYGIYGGPDGDQVLGVLDQLNVPVLTVTHTVLAHPTPRQESVLRRVIDASDVAGQTHPRVRQQQGEAYRDQLRQRAAEPGVADMLRFEDSYLDDAALTRLIRRADVVVLPYDSREQVTSGVLVEAIAAGKPVVATAFPHAVELYATGADPRRRPDASVRPRRHAARPTQAVQCGRDAEQTAAHPPRRRARRLRTQRRLHLRRDAERRRADSTPERAIGFAQAELATLLSRMTPVAA